MGIAIRPKGHIFYAKLRTTSIYWVLLYFPPVLACGQSTPRSLVPPVSYFMADLYRDEIIFNYHKTSLPKLPQRLVEQDLRI